MKILFYMKPDYNEAKFFKYAIESKVPVQNKETYGSIEELKNRLFRPSCQNVIIVFFVKDQNDLDNIASIHAVLRNIRIILILPDHSDTTISKGYSLYPRFLSFFDRNHSEIAAILDKMIMSQQDKEEMRDGSGCE
ncbi:hypothetical protein LLG96_19975 [bacterium]|nr:hypothetical protein [bacterium]